MALLRPCKNTAAFEALPERSDLKLDLDALEAKLVQDGWDRVANAVVMLIVKRDIEVSVYRSGKMLIKTRDPEAARAAFQAIHRYTEPDGDHEPKIEGLERLARRAAH